MQRLTMLFDWYHYDQFISIVEKPPTTFPGNLISERQSRLLIIRYYTESITVLSPDCRPGYYEEIPPTSSSDRKCSPCTSAENCQIGATVCSDLHTPLCMQGMCVQGYFNDPRHDGSLCTGRMNYCDDLIILAGEGSISRGFLLIV